MTKLFCASSNARTIGDKVLYECRIRTDSGFIYSDWYKEPKQVGYHDVDVHVKKYYTKDGGLRWVPVARLGNFIEDTSSI